ncbi:HAD-IC family P-type ATPase [Sphaerisporangium aureirubrum]|uniref:HAD-IC family P-type ATPase n=1 Tax=Sphaerisporangium aureirubrum TaxID=1544736 RepID=A0ABW1NK30_9ACTN
METDTGTPGLDAPHARPAAEVVDGLGGDAETGLTSAEAAGRLARHGPNTLPVGKGQGPIVRFLLQFHNPLIYVLLAAALITALLGGHVDAAVILGVVVVNAVVGFAQESRAENALAALAAMTRTFATMVRDGSRRRVPSTELVPGDLVLLEAGDKIPADLRLIETADLRVDESALTGESLAVSKETGARPDAALADRTGMAYSGTLVTYGTGRTVVTATGAATEIGLIHRLVGRTTAVATPLTRKMTRFSHLITVIVLVLAALTFLIGVLRGQPVAAMVTAAVALAVGAIPEGLPAVVTITLAFGVSRMARRGAIVRRLPAVETLGSTTIICTDKTGTLTENQMTVTAVTAGGREYEVRGTGYAPTGEFLAGGVPVRPSEHPALRECLLCGIACNDARLTSAGGRWDVAGDPTEGALLAAGGKAGLDVPARIDTVPFSSELRYMATLHPGGVLYVKGSIEQVLGMCDEQVGPGGAVEPLDRREATAAALDLGSRALRVLAFARAEVGPGLQTITELPRMTFLGLQAMHDPPRGDAARAVAACHTAGIQVKMITGDHATTARAIGARLGLDGPAMTGAELDERPDEELPDVAERTTVFARVSPEQKLRLIRALQSRDHVIAMTGDGVNDAPALKQADIGVAMGKGTEVAKESSDMVLTDDRFTSIEAAVREGRGVFDNLVKFILWALPANLGLGLLLMAAIAGGGELPILPVQVLWLNMTAVLVLGLPFAVEPAEPGIMRRPPRAPSAPLLSRALTGRVLLVSAVLLGAAFGLFHWEQANGASVAVARTVVVNVFALTLLTYLFNCLSLDRPLLWTGIRRNPWVAAGAVAMIALQLLYTYAPFMNALFRSAPLDATAWIRVCAVAVISYAIVEFTKWAHLTRSRAARGGDKE